MIALHKRTHIQGFTSQAELCQLLGVRGRHTRTKFVDQPFPGVDVEVSLMT